MEEEEEVNYRRERQEVIEAGKKLADSGLIARTWGNISCRVDESRFLITPSGRLYDSLHPEDIVLVNDDLSWEGALRPSSESGIHRAVYRLRPEAGFVIHTHQSNASAASIAGEGTLIQPDESQATEELGGVIPIAAYGLPGSDRLREGVSRAIENTKSKAILMAYHGALCIGRDAAETFRVADILETVCGRFLLSRCEKISGKAAESFQDLYDYYLTTKQRVFPAQTVSIPFEVREAVRSARSDLACLRVTLAPEILAISSAGEILKPYLDDLAQIVGTDVNCVSPETEQVIDGLTARSAVLIKGGGALCGGSCESEAKAVEMVLCKGARAAIAAVLFDRARPIPEEEARFMRDLYLNDYSRR